MGTSKQSLNWRPFESLEDLSSALEESGQVTSPAVKDRPYDTDQVSDPDEKDLFQQAMMDVIPLDRNEEAGAGGILSPGVSGGSARQGSDEMEAIVALQDLVRGGKGFSVAHTPEYMEGTPYRDVHGVITEELHRGRYAIQDHIDLHGLTLEGAQQALENFFDHCLRKGARMILVIHGRGKSSPVKPVIKSMFREWLTAGPFRAWVIAYASARLCDGGAGATYVLLRRRPLTKRDKRSGRRGREA